MAFVTELDGVTFSEGDLEGHILGPITVKAASQNSTLLDVKREMARMVKQIGGNALSKFTYSQKADRGKNLFKWDTERIVATGSVLILSGEPPKG